MENTLFGNKSASKSFQNVAESTRESAEHMASDLKNKTKNLANNASESVSQYYDQASSWMQQNYGKTIGMVGAFVAAGVIGYLIGKRNDRSDFQSSMSK
jgi:ElaB/YqjD/DUF883 family membrane-anchored ribosome-binding protein